MPSVSLVLPMFNEEHYAARAVAAAREALGRTTDDWEIIVVDDGSTDLTQDLLKGLAKDEPRLRVFRNPLNLGLGGALRAGYAQAAKDIVVYTDADLPFDLFELKRAVRLLEAQKADVLTGYRFDRTTEGLRRTLYTLVYSALIRVLFGLRVRDVNFAFKVFRRALLGKLALKSEGSFIDAEFLLRARRAEATIIQIGVDYFPRSRGTSTLSSPRVILGILWDMLRFWREL
jgi:glycosyltransferase involved in cell wall biosynthesis